MESKLADNPSNKKNAAKTRQIPPWNWLQVSWSNTTSWAILQENGFNIKTTHVDLVHLSDEW